MSEPCEQGGVNDGTARPCCHAHNKLLCPTHYARAHFVETSPLFWGPACDGTVWEQPEGGSLYLIESDRVIHTTLRAAITDSVRFIADRFRNPEPGSRTVRYIKIGVHQPLTVGEIIAPTTKRVLRWCTEDTQETLYRKLQQRFIEPDFQDVDWGLVQETPEIVEAVKALRQQIVNLFPKAAPGKKIREHKVAVNDDGQVVVDGLRAAALDVDPLVGKPADPDPHEVESDVEAEVES